MWKRFNANLNLTLFWSEKKVFFADRKFENLIFFGVQKLSLSNLKLDARASDVNGAIILSADLVWKKSI